MDRTFETVVFMALAVATLVGGFGTAMFHLLNPSGPFNPALIVFGFAASFWAVRYLIVCITEDE